MIEIKEVSKSFESHKVLDHINLTIQKGETMVIIGRSGSGKSVLLKHIIGLMRPDSGSIRVDGLEVNRLSGRSLDKLRMKFGMLFQNSALFDSLTVEENVGFGLSEHTRLSPKEIRERVRECLQLVGLPDAESKVPADLSGGMRKRVGLARAIAMRPQIVLYDEPTTGIDPIMSDVINRMIVMLRDRLGVTSVVVTHDMVSAYKVANRIAMLYNGKIVALGSPDEIRTTQDPYVRQFIQGSADGPIREGLPDDEVIVRWSSRKSA